MPIVVNTIMWVTAVLTLAGYAAIISAQQARALPAGLPNLDSVKSGHRVHRARPAKATARPQPSAPRPDPRTH
jgi:hypothetical protein